MPTRRKRPLNFVARGVSDAIDSTNAPQGAMAALSNLIPAPHTAGLFVPRPAAQQITAFSGFLSPGQVTAIFPNGSRVYGMVSTGDYPGYDVPFCFDVAAQAFIPVANGIPPLLPLSPATGGDWTPPAMAIVGTRIVVTHPGFSGGTGNPAFGWFDISNFTLSSLTGNTTSGSTTIASIAGDGTSAPIGDGVAVGQKISGAGIPANTFVADVSNGVYSVNTTGNTMTGHALLFNVGAISDSTGSPFVYGMYVKASGLPVGTQVLATGTFKLNTTGNIKGQFQKTTAGDLTTNSTTIDNVLDTNGVVAGMTLSGVGIPAETTIVSFTANSILMSAKATATIAADPIVIFQQGSNTITNVASTAGVYTGMKVTGTGIPDNTIATQISGNVVTISNIPTQTLTADAIIFDGGNTITLSQAATATNQGVAVNVSGGGSITLSQAATATANGVQLTIAGGTPGNPLWYAGNTGTHPLPSVPVSVTAFNTRAYFACGNSVVVSDTLNAVQRSDASFALTLGDNQPITAVKGLPLDSQVTGGVIQSVLAFKGSSGIFQITGDPAVGNWAQNALNVSIGTFAPNSVTPTPYGLAFIAPDGLRMVDFSANVGDPIGAYGLGVSVPFINASPASRICAAYNQNVLRISVFNPLAQIPQQEWWYDFELKIWTGPHTFPFGLIASFYAATGNTSGHGFVGVPWGSGTIFLVPVPTPLPDNTIQAFGTVSPNGDWALADWANRRFYCPTAFQNGVVEYNIDTGAVIASKTAAQIGVLGIGSESALDSNGNIYFQSANWNYDVVYQVAPGLTPTGSFGTANGGVFPQSAWPNPTSHGNLNCVKVDANYLVTSASVPGGAYVLNVDTMQFAGYATTLLTQGDGIGCAGPQSSASATLYFLDFPHSGAFTTTKFYSLTIAAGAAAYNPATWPTPNSAISTATIATIHATDIDATWTHITGVLAIMYDATDGNVIFTAATTDAVTHTKYVVKLNAATGAVLWATAIAPANLETIGGSPGSNVRLQYGLLALKADSGHVYCLNTLTGAIATTVTITGLGLAGDLASDDATGDILVYGSYVQAGGNVDPVGGTPSTYTTLWGRLDLAGNAGVGMIGRLTDGGLWASEATPIGSVSYTENGMALSWAWQTSLLPDNAQMSMNAVIETALGILLPVNETVTVACTDESGSVLDSVSLSGPVGPATIWGAFVWGAATWFEEIAAPPYFAQRRIAWHKPLVFKQMQMGAAGQSAYGFAIGNLYLGYEPLGYMLETG